MRASCRTILLLCALGALLIEGCAPSNREFYPIGIYTVATEEAFRDASDAGFNTVHVYSTKPDEVVEAEKLAERFGLNLVCYPGHHPRRDGSFDAHRVDETLDRLKYSDGILAWYLYDEPEGRGLPPNALHDFHLYVKERSPRIPTAFVVGNGEGYRDYAGCSDIAMLDWYPIPLHKLESIAYHIERCRDYLSRGQAMWMVVQAFDWTVFSERVRKEGTGRAPTLDELRAMTFLSVAEGVDGVFYWSYRTPRNEWKIREHPELWQAVRQMASELNSLYPFLISTREIDGLNVLVNGEARSPTVKCLFKRVTASELRGTRRAQREGADSVLDAGRYLLAVNASDREIAVEFSGFGDVENEVREIFDDGKCEVFGGRLKDVLEPYEVKLYCLGR